MLLGTDYRVDWKYWKYERLREAVDTVLAWAQDEKAECGNVLNADAVIRRLTEALKGE